jgi:guanidinoacetate N-methyltransferase
MQRWQQPLMRRLAQEATQGRSGDILEVGFGMGISAQELADIGCRSYTVIEAHPEIAETARQWGLQQQMPVYVIEGFWQRVIPELEKSFDGIVFDTFPLADEECGRNHFAFIPHAPRLLRENGALALYSDETIDFRQEHLRLLLSNFSDVRLVRVDGLAPPPGEHWAHDTMVVPVAYKRGA